MRRVDFLRQTGYFYLFAAGNQLFPSNLSPMLMRTLFLAVMFLYCVVGHSQELGWVVSNGGSGEDSGYQVASSPDETVVVYGSISENPDFDPGPGLVPVETQAHFIAKYSRSGELVWVNFHEFIPGSVLGIDHEGNIVVAGNFYGTVDFDPGDGTHSLSAGIDWNAFVAKYSSAGDFLWVKQFAGTNHESFSAIAIDHLDEIILTGRFHGQLDVDPGLDTFWLNSPAGSNPYVLKLDPDGQFIWAGHMNSGPFGQINALGVDESNQIYGVGYYEYFLDVDMGPDTVLLDDLVGPSNGFAVKLTPSGQLVWANDFAFSDDNKGSLGTLAVTSDGHTWVAGRFKGDVDVDPGPDVQLFSSDGTFTDILMLHFDPDGALLDAYQLGGPGADAERSILVSDAGLVYLAGAYQQTVDFDPGVGQLLRTAVNGSDIFVAKFEETGHPEWVACMGGPKSEDPRDIALDDSGNVFLTGGYNGTVDFDPGPEDWLLTSKPGIGTGSDYFLMRIDDETTPIALPHLDDAAYIEPNPVSGNCRIVNVPELRQVRVYSIQGVAVLEGTTEFLDVEDLPAGLYYVVISTDQENLILPLIKQ